jgi:hypothetical protein
MIVPVEEFERLNRKQMQPERLVDFFANAPTGGQTLELHRKRDATRDIDW